MASDLPDFERPPVVEIVAAVQFSPIPQFGMKEAISVARAFQDWGIVDAPPALPPIVEPPPGESTFARFDFALGTPPLRLILESTDGRWLLQIQQDRIAVHERDTGSRPSFANVAPRLEELAPVAGEALDQQILAPAHPAEIVELTYRNSLTIDEGRSSHAELGKVLRVVGDSAATDSPYDQIEALMVGFSVVLQRGERFVGRLRVHAEPARDEAGKEALQLRLISRRYLFDLDLPTVMEECHRDIVEGFTSITDPAMHAIWGRVQ